VAGKKQMKPGPGYGPAGGPENDGGQGQEQQQRPNVMDVIKQAEQALGKVECKYGAHTVMMDYHGLSVAEAENHLRDLFGVEEDAEAYVNGDLVGDKHGTMLKQGQRLEFMKEAGTKG
jgi:hypothetical protein